MSYCFPVLLISFISSALFLLNWECSVLFCQYLLLPSLFFTFYIFSFFSLELFILLYCSIRFIPQYCSLHSIFMSFLGNYSRNSAKDRGRKIDTDVKRFEEPDVIPKSVSPAIICRAVSTDPDEFQRRFHGIDLTCGSGFDLIVIRAVVIHKDTFLI